MRVGGALPRAWRIGPEEREADLVVAPPFLCLVGEVEVGSASGWQA